MLPKRQYRDHFAFIDSTLKNKNKISKLVSSQLSTERSPWATERSVVFSVHFLKRIFQAFFLRNYCVPKFLQNSTLFDVFFPKYLFSYYNIFFGKIIVDNLVFLKNVWWLYGTMLFSINFLQKSQHNGREAFTVNSFENCDLKFPRQISRNTFPLSHGPQKILTSRKTIIIFPNNFLRGNANMHFQAKPNQKNTPQISWKFFFSRAQGKFAISSQHFHVATFAMLRIEIDLEFWR